jgi:hypothetical protein
MPQFIHIEEALNDLKSISQLTESDYDYLIKILSNLAHISKSGYGQDFPQDYIGIGGELL